MFERLMIVGPGRLGLALGYALWQADAVRHLVFCGRRPDPPSHPLFGQDIAEYHFGLLAPPRDTDAVILAVPAAVLPELAHALAGQGRPSPNTVALHTAGALSADVLGPLHAVGYSVGILHPFQSVGHPIHGAERLPGSAFAVSGEAAARRLGRRLVVALDGDPLEIPVARRPEAHAASVLVTNGLVALMRVGLDLFEHAGVAPDHAEAAVVALARGALADVEAGAIPRGPIAEDDHEAVDLHLRSLRGDPRELYRSVSRILLDEREARSGSAGETDALRFLLGTPVQESSEDEP